MRGEGNQSPRTRNRTCRALAHFDGVQEEVEDGGGAGDQGG